MRNLSKPTPSAYFITCRTYGTWLHGDARGSVDPQHNQFLMPMISTNFALEKMMHDHCKELPFLMNDKQREIVLQSIIDTCHCSHWHLHAAHVRTNHMHIVLNSNDKEPKRVAVSLKAYATRYLKKKPAVIEKSFGREARAQNIFSKRIIY